ncbi:MAG TPA: AIR synthase-related protein, partial [Ferruginibacter sp.]|nr:AIR synthase-related protein [Ferruginibacter sp.]
RSGDVIVGLASYGQATYESSYNSGIGSNGLTSARHDVLGKFYAEYFKESYDNNLSDDVVYIGKHKLSDPLQPQTTSSKPQTIGQLILSPTRTYAPVMKLLLEQHFDKIHGLIHCSGGGQTKCMKYLPGTFRIIKDNLFETPEIFSIIRQNSGSSDKEMYEVFNMGCRLEIYCEPADAAIMIEAANQFGIAAQVIGRVEASDKKELVIKTVSGEIYY